MNNKKMIRRILMTMTIMVTLLAAWSITAQAASTKSKAMAAYKTFLEEHIAQRNSRGAITNAMEAVTSFAIVYLDKDSVPELIVKKADLFFDPYVYQYKNGQVVGMECPTPGARYEVTGYYKKKGCLVMSYESNGYPNHSFITEYLVIKGNKLIQRLQKQYLGTEKKVVEGPNYKLNRKNTVDSYPSKSISKSKFNTKLKGIVGSKKMTKIKYVDNTEANRDKKCK